MATLMACATGNFTSSSTWALCDSTSELDSNSATTTVTTGNTDSSTFTPGAITVDGVAVKLWTRAASPTGTFTVTLRNSTDATNVDSVTVNVSDLPADTETGNSYHNGWLFLKFGSSHLLLAGKAYLVRVTTSSSSQVALLGNFGNISRQLRTTTTQAPAANDKLIITGEWTAAATCTSLTVTMDHTAATSYGTVSMLESLSICKNGTLTWGTAASTAYALKIAGYIYIATGGTMNMGTSGTPMPSTSSAILDFNNTGNVDSGIRVAGGSLYTYGNSKTVITTVTSTANSGQAVVNVAACTNWANPDQIILTPTERQSSQYELRTISSIATLAVTVTSNFTNKHSGSSSASVPNTVRGHVGMITHNVKIRGKDNSNRAFIYCATNGTLNMRYTECQYLGSQFSSGKQGIIWGGTGYSVDIQYISISNMSFVGTAGADFTTAFTFSNNVLYTGDGSMIRISASNNSVAYTVSGNLVVNSAGNGGILTSHTNGATYSNNICSGGHQMGIWIASASWVGANRAMLTGTFSGNECYNNSGSGYQLDAIPPYMTITGGACWRNGSEAFYLNNINLFLTLDGVAMFGNGNQHIHTNVSTPGMVVKNCVFNGETSFATTRGVYGGVNVGWSEIMFVNCDFSQTVAHGSFDFAWNNTPHLRWTVVNCRVGAPTVVQTMSGSANFNLPMVGSIIRFQRYNGTAGDHRTFQAYCNTKTDTVIYKTTSPSERITPRESVALFKSKSDSKKKTIDTGQTASVSVQVRKSVSTDSGGANYNGNQIRLICRQNHAVGITADTVVATGSAAVGTWELLSGTVGPTSGDNGVLEFYVDCDGTVGWINVDDWTISAA